MITSGHAYSDILQLSLILVYIETVQRVLSAVTALFAGHGPRKLGGAINEFPPGPITGSRK